MHDLLLVLYLTFLALGNVFLVYAVYTARAAWREDIPPYGYRTPSFEVVFHPERFVRSEKVRIVRRYGLLGFIFLLFCLIAVFTDIFLSVGL